MGAGEFTDIAHPPVSSTDELIDCLGGLAARMGALSEAFVALNQWCRDANVARHVCDMVDAAMGHAGEVSVHMATAELNAEQAYCVRFPDFERTP